MDGDITTLYVARTYPITSEQGLVLTKSEAGETRVFEARESGFRELTDWNRLQVIDVAIEGRTNAMLVLASDKSKPDSFAVYRARSAESEKLEINLELGADPPTAITWWTDAIFIGTASGKILKATASLSGKALAAVSSLVFGKN